MKKCFLWGILLVALLAGCVKQNVVINYTDIASSPVDMSAYKNMNSVNHHFREITPAELIKVFEDKGSGAFYLGSDTCAYCQETVRYMNEAAEELDLTVYYVDVYDKQHPLMDHYQEIYDLLYPVLNERNGKKSVQTPHYFTLINGEIASSCVGGLKDTPEETIDYYKSLLEVLVP